MARSPKIAHQAQRFGAYSRPVVVILAGASLMTLATTVTQAQSTGRQTFASRSACEMGRLLSADECKLAFTNAGAELDEKAPRFSKREECERLFRRCQIAGYGSAGKGVEFAPALKGVEVVVRSSTDKTVRPVLEQDNPGVSFDARSAVKADSGQSLSTRARAQAKWAEAQRALANAPVEFKGGSTFDSGPYDPKTDSFVPSAPTGPLDPIAEEKRRERLRNAPQVN